MEREEILKKAIEKASIGGWYKVNGSIQEITVYDSSYADCYECNVRYENNDEMSFLFDLIIFDHEFAKAFWGERDCKCSGFALQYNQGCTGESCEKGWKHHIQQLALSTDRLEYISKFI
jgi:hypothetical protein